MKIERSMRPISFSALASAFWRGAAAIFLRMTDGGALLRYDPRSSIHCLCL